MSTLQETVGAETTTATQRPWRKIVSSVANLVTKVVALPERETYMSDHYRPAEAVEAAQATQPDQQAEADRQAAAVPVAEVGVATTLPTDESWN